MSQLSTHVQYKNIMEKEWKDIEGFEGRYQVSDAGEVMSIGWHGGKTNKLLKPSLQSNGYLSVSLGKIRKTKKIHRLVCEAFHPNPDNKDYVNHKDGIKTNNFKDNVEWSTPKENSEHAVANNLHDMSGESNIKAKVTEGIVRAMRCSDLSNRELSVMYGISYGNACRITSGSSWKHVN